MIPNECTKFQFDIKIFETSRGVYFFFTKFQKYFRKNETYEGYPFTHFELYNLFDEAVGAEKWIWFNFCL